MLIVKNKDIQYNFFKFQFKNSLKIYTGTSGCLKLENSYGEPKKLFGNNEPVSQLNFLIKNYKKFIIPFLDVSIHNADS